VGGRGGDGHRLEWQIEVVAPHLGGGARRRLRADGECTRRRGRLLWLGRRHHWHHALVVRVQLEHVLLQQEIAREGGAAQLTLERSLARVRQNVPLEVRRPAKAFVAVRAHVFFVRLHRPVRAHLLRLLLAGGGQGRLLLL